MHSFKNGILPFHSICFLFSCWKWVFMSKSSSCSQLEHPLLTFCGFVTDHWIESSGIFYIQGPLLLEAILTSYFLKIIQKICNWSYDDYEFHDLDSPLGFLVSSHRANMWLDVHIVIVFLKDYRQLCISEDYRNSGRWKHDQSFILV